MNDQTVKFHSWIACSDLLPPEKRVVNTKIDDKDVAGTNKR